MMLEALAEPQSCIPYVHIGLSMVLYIKILLSVFRLEFLPSSQFRFLYFILISSLLLSTCFFQVSRRSRCIPRYLTCSQCICRVPFKVTGAEFSLHKVKVICTDLAALTEILHFFNHFSMSYRLFCRISDARAGFLSEAIMAVSSAKVATVTSGLCGKSDVNMVYRIGPSTEPWGTPAAMS